MEGNKAITAKCSRLLLPGNKLTYKDSLCELEKVGSISIPTSYGD